MFGNSGHGHPGHACTSQCRFNHKVDVVQGDRPLYIQAEALPGTFEIPAKEPATGEAKANASVGFEVLRLFRRRMLLKVVWRGDGGEAQVRAEANGDHVPRHIIDQANARVEAVTDNILQSVVCHELDIDVRITADKIRHHMADQRQEG